MKLTRLEVKNFLGVEAFEADFGGAPVIAIEAENGAGKTSVLRAVQALFAGGKAIPEVPIKRGAKRAQIIGQTETLICKRTFSKSGTKLEVRPTEKGAIKLSSPQAVLDELVGLFLDPLEFDRMDRTARAAVLRDLVGLDFGEADARRKELEVRRRDAGRDLKSARARLEAMPPPIEGEEVESVSELLAEIERREQVNDDHASRRGLLGKMRAEATDLAGSGEAKGEIERLDITIREMEADLVDFRNQREDAVARLEKLREDGTKLASEVGQLIDLDVDEVRAKLSRAEERAAAVAKQDERKRLEGEVEELGRVHSGLDSELKQIDADKARQLDEAQYPIEGLELMDGETYLDGVPWEQCNASRRITASTAIALSTHPQLKIVCVQNASLLDERTRRTMHELVAAAGGQAFLEIVGSGDEIKVVIEEGGAS
jgi:DNA repair exonuclease SbcCD ATPase subunit